MLGRKTRWWFYLKPEIGYHNQDWNFAVQYTKVFTGDKGNLPGKITMSISRRKAFLTIYHLVKIVYYKK